MKIPFRYPGTKSFSTEEEKIFFGRDEDIHDLLTSILVCPTTVLFGYSGTGKSSLIRAGLIPQLYRHLPGEDSGFDNYRIVEVSPKVFTEGKRLWPEIRKAVFPQLNLEQPFIPEDDTTPPASFWHLLKKDQYNQELDDYQLTTLFIFDQAEELFTYCDHDVNEFVSELQPVIGQFIPEDFRSTLAKWPVTEDTDALVQRNKTLNTPLRVKFLFSIRSDKLHLITRLKRASSLILQNSFELLALTRKQAYASMRRPAKKSGEFASNKFTIAEDASIRIFDELYTLEGTTMYNPEECRVDPFSLQIICTFIEQQLVIRNRLQEVTVDALGDIKAIINGYYEDSINSLVFADRPPTDAEKDMVRDFLELRMIVNNRRLPIPDALILGDPKYVISQEILDQLVEKRILKADIIAGGYMYEITHDSFIRPMLEARTRRLNAQSSTASKSAQSITELQNTIIDKWALHRSKEAVSTRVSVAKKEQAGKKPEITEMVPPVSARMDMELYKDYKKLGDAYFLDKDFVNAVRWLGLAAEIPPEFAESTFLADIYKARSNAYYNQNEIDASTEDLKRMLRLVPGDRQAIGYLIANYDMQNRMEEGIAYLEKEQITTGENISVFTDLGFGFIDADKFDKAEQYFRITLSRRPSDYGACRGMGIVEGNLKNPEEAKAWFEKALSVEPQNPQPYSDIAYAYLINTDLDKAIEWYLRSLSLKQDYAKAIVGLTRAYYEKGDVDHLQLAHEVYLRLTSIDTPTEYFHYNLGIIEEALGQVENAVDNYSKAIVSDPVDDDAHRRLASLLLTQGHPEKLEQLYRRLIIEKPEAAKFYEVFLAKAFEKQGRIAEAIDLNRMAIAADPSFVYPHFRLGDLYYGLDQPETAIDEYKKAMNLDPADSGYPTELGYLYRYLGNYEESIGYFNLAIKLAPAVDGHYLGLGGVYFRKKDYDQAILQFENALKQKDASLLSLASLAACYREKGMGQKCAELIADLRQKQASSGGVVLGTYDAACVEALCDNAPEALRLLKQALDNKDIWPRYVQRDSDFYLLQDNQEFRELVGLVGQATAGSATGQATAVLP